MGRLDKGAFCCWTVQDGVEVTAVATAAVATVVEVTTRDEGEEEEEDDDEEEEEVMFPTNDEVGYGK